MSNPSDTLQIFRRQSPVTVLGPYQRAVIWVQGCAFACPGCIVPESWPSGQGEAVRVLELADWILAQPGIEGITLSGGEPMLQAQALDNLIDRVRQVRDLGVVCYTGDRLERLVQQGTPAQRALLKRIDLLIDGPYVESRHADLLWRGSDNQRLLLLTKRYRQVLAGRADCSAGLTFAVAEDGSLAFTGVPSQPQFRVDFEAKLAGKGIVLQP
jgi:anaerobic ribonucleoside-triphosphate reductase activating protein